MCKQKINQLIQCHQKSINMRLAALNTNTTIIYVRQLIKLISIKKFALRIICDDLWWYLFTCYLFLLFIWCTMIIDDISSHATYFFSSHAVWWSLTISLHMLPIFALLMLIFDILYCCYVVFLLCYVILCYC